MTQSGTGLALCLAGGGVSGAFYEFGAVAALEAGIDGWTVAQAPVVVGTSCGSIVGSFLALGIAATEPLTAARTGPKHPLWLNTRDVYRLPLDRHARGWVKALAGLPDSIRGREKGRRDSWLDVVFDMHRKLPSGVFTNEGIARVIGKAARWSGRDGSFAALDMPLRITATDLNEASRAVFGHGHVMDVPVGLAACASTCIPYYMEPVRILGRDYIDGQIWNPIHLDLGVVPATRAVLAVTLSPPTGRPVWRRPPRPGTRGAWAAREPRWSWISRPALPPRSRTRRAGRHSAPRIRTFRCSSWSRNRTRCSIS